MIRGQLYTQAALDRRKRKLLEDGYTISKWLTFCEDMHALGLRTFVYEAQSTRSKYVYVERDGKHFKVRFSNHAPRLDRELGKDCDFFVGKTNLGVSLTRHAVEAVKEFFGIDDRTTCKVCHEKIDAHSMQANGVCVFCN